MTDAADLETVAKQLLADLIKSGLWMITGHDGTDDGRAANNSVWMNCLRVWMDGSADSLVVEALDKARAQRNDARGGVEWRSSGHLADVLRELHELDPPNDVSQATTAEVAVAPSKIPLPVPPDSG